MAQFNPALITTNLLEAAVVELCMRLQRAEQQFTPANGDRQPNKIQVSIDTDAKTVKISATLPIEFGFVSGGSIGVVGVEYLPGIVPDDGFQPTPGQSSNSYLENFVDSDLNPTLTVTHNLGEIPSSVLIRNNEDDIIVPDGIDDLTTTSLFVNLTSYRPLQGVWTVIVGI